MGQRSEEPGRNTGLLRKAAEKTKRRWAIRNVLLMC